MLKHFFPSARGVVVNVLLLAFYPTPFAIAQYRAAIQGTVTGTSGAVVPGVKVTISNVACIPVTRSSFRISACHRAMCGLRYRNSLDT